MIRAIVSTAAIEYCPGETDRLLLNQGDVREAHFDTQVAARDHQSVEGANDLDQVVHGLRLLDLREHRYPRSCSIHDGVNGIQIGGPADERQGDQIGTQR
jgi:hypothetical protein